MAFKQIISQLSRLLAAVVGLTLAGYIGYLVLSQYRTQLILQDATLKQLISDSSRRATAVGYFLSERREDLKELGQSREMSAYFENKALGMSMEYGLRASLIMIEELASRMRTAKKLSGAPVFERIVFLDASGSLLCDTQKGGNPGSAGPWSRYLTPKAVEPVMTVQKHGGEVRIVVATPVQFKGRYAGQLVGWISATHLYRDFIEGSGETNRYPVALVFGKEYLTLPQRVQGMLGAQTKSLPPDITPQVPYRLNPAADGRESAGDAILVPVEGSPLSLVTFVPHAELSGPHSPRRILYTTGGIALFILLGLFYFQTMATRNAVLKAHLEETTLREAAVDEKNRLLAGEIEERRQTEAALRQSETRFRAIVSTVPVVIYEFRQIGPSRRFSFVGDKIRELAGLEPAAMLADARAFLDLIHPQERETVLAASDHSVATGERLDHEFRIVKPSGEVRWILASSLPHSENAEGESVWCGCLEDITDRKQASLVLMESRQQLLESEATLRSLLDTMPAGVWWYNDAGEPEYLNERFAELFGYRLAELPTVEEWLRHAYPDPLVRAQLQATRGALIAEARRNGSAVPPQETRICCRDGSVRHIIVNTQLSQGRTLEIFTDITQQEFIHNELLKVQKMESLGVLAGGIAHDFNNILTGIMGNISFAQMVLTEGSEALAPLEAAEMASRRAAELAHQLLTFAKGGQPIKKVVSVARLVEEAVSLSLRGTSAQARLELPEDLDRIEADAGQINQAFNNILINATHAMPGGGTLTVSGENVTLDATDRVPLPPGRYVKLVFSDEGCGIPEADLKNIFDPYFTTKAGGNGLGLASTLSVITRHGGHITVQSEVGVGTSFTCYLPSTKGAAPRPESAAPAVSAPPGGGKVLVMDDEEMLRALSLHILSHLGYQVTTCADGEAAIELYSAAKEEGAPYFAVIMDLTIPGGMGGKEAAQRILAHDPGARLIVSSGYSNDLALSDYRNYGFCGAVVKPYKVAELAETLQTVRSL